MRIYYSLKLNNNVKYFMNIKNQDLSNTTANIIKMQKMSVYSLIGTFIVLMSACAGEFQTYDLSEEYSTSLHYQPTGEEGVQPNSTWPFQKIENSEEFKDYYFDIQDKEIFTQTLPKKHKVNGALINSVKFFINPGQSAFTGKIFIKEIKVVPAVNIGK